MSKSHIQVHPNAKSKHLDQNKNQNLKKLDKLAQKYSWLVIGVFAISTVVVLGLVVNEIRGNVGQAALDLTGYNSWKTTYGLNASANDANWNQSGDGITNYNKYTLNQSLNNVFDGSVIPTAVQTSSGSTSTSSTSSTSGSIPTVGGPTTVANRTLDASAPAISANATTSGSTTTPTVGSSNSLTPTNLNPNGPALSNPIPSTTTSTSGTISGRVASSSGGTTIANPSNNGGSTAIPLPIPGSSSSGIVASNTGTTSVTNSSSTGTTAITNSNGTQIATSANTTSLTKTSGVSVVQGTKTVTDRSGGEINFVIFAFGLISLFTGGYILKNKFTKNLLAVHQGEKSGKS